MAAVLFVITIPSEVEEMRLKNAFLSSKTSKAFKTSPELIDKKSINANEDLNDQSESNIGLALTPVKGTSKPQYGTFPKRAKSQSNKDVHLQKKSRPETRRKSCDDLQSILSTTSNKRTKIHKKKHYNLELNLAQDACLELVLREILKIFQISNAIWIKDKENRIFQVMFTTEFNEIYENILDKFHEWGIGDREGSTVCVMNCIAAKNGNNKEDNEYNKQCFKTHSCINVQKQSVWEKFMNSVRSRLNVAQIVRDVRQEAAITFDFIVSLIAAAILASFGLAEDNTILLVSSMLISPLMGPIIAGIFGTVIKDRSLRTLGVKNELLGILFATGVGFIFGLIICSVDERYSSDGGPTNEMMGRCDLHSLLVGVVTAVPAGAAAAISILGGNIGSLVGVAISASLLPPAVNSGLLWSLATVYKLYESDTTRYTKMVQTQKYSENQATELTILGSISMCLTLSNVICIYLMGILVLKVKEIAPVISRNNREFWKYDIKIARDLNKNGLNADRALMKELNSMPQEDQKVLGFTGELLRNMQLEEAIYRTWSPMPIRPNLSALQLENRYSTIIRPQELRPRFSFNYPARLQENAYSMLQERYQRRATMPSKLLPSSIRLLASKHSNVSEESGFTAIIDTPPNDQYHRRKFIVTPAADPLHCDLHV